MWCEDGWCGHYRDWNEDFYPEEIIAWECDLENSSLLEVLETHSLSREDFFSLLLDEEQNLDDIPHFLNVTEFMASDFFAEHYDLWSIDLQGKWMWDICNQEQETIQRESWQVLMLRPVNNSVDINRASKLQKMLLGLWYLSRDSLDSTTTYTHWVRETSIVYLWALWQTEHLAMRQFQTNNQLLANWVFSETERQKIYTQIFENFHKID